MKKIWLAGGCFWGIEAYFRQLKGVEGTRVGYGQGATQDPAYEEVCSGETGHAEVCEITYDETVLSLKTIMEHLFRIIDPVSLNRQGADRGTQYRSGVYYREEEERKVIIDFIKEQQPFYSAPIVVEVEPLSCFYPAEAYHQNYLQKMPHGYCHINLRLAKPEEKKS